MHDSSLALAARLFMAMACCRHCYCYYLQYGAAASPLLSVLPFPLCPLSSFSLSFSPLLLCGLCSRFDDTSDSDRRFHRLIGGRGRHLPWLPPLHFARCLFACVRAFYCSAVSRHHIHSPSSSSPADPWPWGPDHRRCARWHLSPRSPKRRTFTLLDSRLSSPALLTVAPRQRISFRSWSLLGFSWLGLSQRCWLLLRPLALPLLCSALRVASFLCPDWLFSRYARTMLPACCAWLPFPVSPSHFQKPSLSTRFRSWTWTLSSATQSSRTRPALVPADSEMAEVKPEDMVHHLPMDQLQGLEYCIDSNPSWGTYICHTHAYTIKWSIAVHLWLVGGCYRRRDRFGLPTLHTVLGHCCHDPHAAGSSYGWKWCEHTVLTRTRVVSWFCFELLAFISSVRMKQTKCCFCGTYPTMQIYNFWNWTENSVVSFVSWKNSLWLQKSVFSPSLSLLLLKGWQGQGGSNAAVRYWDQDAAPDAIRHSSSHNHGRFIRVRGSNPLHSPWPLVRAYSW
jgi:hypothetical protein